MANKVLAIDPGNVQSAWLKFDPVKQIPEAFAIAPNEDIIGSLEATDPTGMILAVETFVPRGQPLYWQLVETAIWIGRFEHAWGGSVVHVTREEAKYHVCRARHYKDSNIRAALIDRWGGKDVAVGRKADPGPLYGVKKDLWAALAVAVTYADSMRPVRKVKRKRCRKSKS